MAGGEQASEMQDASVVVVLLRWRANDIMGGRGGWGGMLFFKLKGGYLGIGGLRKRIVWVDSAPRSPPL